MNVQEKLDRCFDAVRERISFRPEVAMILGSGLGAFGEQIQVEAALPYGEIEGFPVSTVSGHTGRFLFGTVSGVPVVVMQGRVHYYEGYAMSDVVLPTRLMGLLGAKAFLLTNAAGGLNFDFAPGDFMLISDQISTFVPSPLTGPNLERLGPRFPDMSAIYDREFREIVRGEAKAAGIPLREGVYFQFPGPQFESPAEVRMARTLGADAVGMSTACEAIAARHMGLRVCGISCISNLGCGMTGEPLSSEEVDDTANRVAPQFRELVTRAVRGIGKAL